MRFPVLDAEVRWCGLREWVEHQVRSLTFKRLRDAVAEPVSIETMDELLIEQTMSADVIPVDVGGGNDDREIDKRTNDRAYVGNPSSGVHERSAVAADEEVAVHVLPVAVFGQCERRLVDPLNGEPVKRCCRGDAANYPPARRPELRFAGAERCDSTKRS
jgi:hypothetical protein